MDIKEIIYSIPIVLLVLLMWSSSNDTLNYHNSSRSIEQNAPLENKILKLKSLIDNDEEFNYILDLIKYAVKEKGKFYYSRQDYVDLIDKEVTKEILKRINK